jgi:hypothetical protein
MLSRTCLTRKNQQVTGVGLLRPSTSVRRWEACCNRDFYRLVFELLQIPTKGMASTGA